MARLPARPLTTAEAEEYLTRALDLAEDAAEEYERRAGTAARAEAAYRIARARHVLRSPGKTADLRDANTTVAVADLLVDREVSAAARDAQAEICRCRRADIEALRTLVASARAAEHGRG